MDSLPKISLNNIYFSSGDTQHYLFQYFYLFRRSRTTFFFSIHRAANGPTHITNFIRDSTNSVPTSTMIIVYKHMKHARNRGRGMAHESWSTKRIGGYDSPCTYLEYGADGILCSLTCGFPLLFFVKCGRDFRKDVDGGGFTIVASVCK